MERSWDSLVADLAATVERLRPGQFVILEYLGERPSEPLPYAQAAPDLDGWYCEIVSTAYLPPTEWPLDEVALRRSGWLVPDGVTDNWWRTAPSGSDAARLLVEGLRSGRACQNPDLFLWNVGTFPDGPKGGVPLPVPSVSALAA